MTMISNYNMECSVCGETSEQRVLSSTNSFGYPDLDFRPPEMKRSTMRFWIQECPNCGYVASYLSNELEIPKDFLKTDEYLNCDGFEFTSNLSKKFYKAYLIFHKSNNLERSLLNLQHCAWKCDDEEDPLAVDVRKMGIAIIDEMLESESEEALILIKADFLRRCGLFDELIREFEGITLDCDEYNQVIQYQIEKARQKDDACYTTEEIFG